MRDTVYQRTGTEPRPAPGARLEQTDTRHVATPARPAARLLGYL
jgi:hypothetical protein